VLIFNRTKGRLYFLTDGTIKKMKIREDEKEPGIKILALNEIVDSLLNRIGPRAKELLELRFGLTGKRPKSLSAIGKKMGITRERVRQIENDSFRKLKKINKDDQYQAIIKKAVEIVESYGGFCEKKRLKKMIKNDVSDLERRYLMIILNACNHLDFQKGNQQLEAFWYDGKKVQPREISHNVKKVLGFIQVKGRPVRFGEILKFAKSLNGEFFSGEPGEKKLRMILSISKDLQRNILEEWGWKKWNLISGKGSRERAYLVLKKHKEPMHFRDLSDKINKYYKGKITLPQTVHNELIKDNRFVQVGKGTYGLAEWGLVSGTVKDVIMQLLREKNKAAKEEILEYVLSQKKVKKTTIAVNLANQNIFSKDEQGNYFLVID
jgi:hypothetical protein